MSTRAERRRCARAEVKTRFRIPDGYGTVAGWCASQTLKACEECAARFGLALAAS